MFPFFSNRKAPYSIHFAAQELCLWKQLRISPTSKSLAATSSPSPLSPHTSISRKTSGKGLASSSWKQTPVDSPNSFHLKPTRQYRYFVPNPSYGIRLGKNLRFYWFYDHFLDQAHKVLQAEGRVALLVLRVLFFKDAMKQLKLWQIEWSQKIELGGKKVRVFVLRKQC
ncbi:MAG: hypothetical protein AAF587_29315 [Bacteroidota bacterium]